ncbi:hypothetical protein [Cellulomonas denverensis]|uniref:hypothetical protein n=1 Tax=Cellulomonas denverensis TaxID=264297 RepID=UPI0035F0E317
MIDAWTGRAPASTEFPRTETDGVKQLVGKLQGLSADLRESTSNLLRTAGIYLTEAGMRIASSPDHRGRPEFDGVGQLRWNLVDHRHGQHRRGHECHG